MSNARFSIMPAIAVSDERISNAQLRTLAALAIFGDKEGWCYPRLKTLGDLLHKSRQAVSMDIKKLVELGYIEKKPQHREDGSRGSNLYRIMFDNVPNLNTLLSSEVEGVLSPEVDTPLSSEVDALTPHNNDTIKRPILKNPLSGKIEEIFSEYQKEWNKLFPDKSQLSDGNKGVRTAIKKALKRYGTEIEDNWKQALYNASLSPYLHSKSWCNSTFIWGQNDNGINYEKCLTFYYDSQDEKLGTKGSDKARQKAEEIVLTEDDLRMAEEIKKRKAERRKERW